MYVNAQPCKMSMLQIVTLRGEYQYQIAHIFIINLTDSAMWYNNFMVLCFTLKIADNKITDWWA